MSWSGSFVTVDWPLSKLVSPDGRFAIVTPLPYRGEGEPTLFRLGPDGPIATLSSLTGANVVFPEWLVDSKRIRVGLRTRTAVRESLRTIDDPDVFPAVLDLGTLELLREPKASWDPVAGRSTAPDWDCSSASKEARLLLCPEEKGFLVSERRNGKVERGGPSFLCDVDRRAYFSLSGEAVVVRCGSELVVARLGEAIVRIALDERALRLNVVAWGAGAKSVALGGKPICALIGECADLDDPRAFEAATGREIAATGFRGEGAAWSITGVGSKLWADHRWEPLRRPLPGTPSFLWPVAAKWENETRVTVSALVPPFSGSAWREVVLDLPTARVISSRKSEGPLAPEDPGRARSPSPSGALAIQPHGENLRITVTVLSSGKALPIFFLSVGERTFAVARSPAGWFTGDPEAFAALRFARGTSLFEAEPLVGTDVCAQFERPGHLRDFLAGRAVPLEPAGVLGRAR